jgi:GGDEF domain-containing protein
MVELSVRLLLSGLLVFIAGVLGVPAFPIAFKIGMMQVALAMFHNRLEARSLRTPAMAALLAGADSLLITLTLAAIPNALGIYSLVALAPIIIAAAKHRANPFLMAPIAAASIVGAHMAHHEWKLPPNEILIQSLLFLAIGSLVKPMKIQREIVIERVEEPTREEIDLSPIVLEAENQILELRESYRQMCDAYRVLYRKSNKDRVAAIIAEARGGYFRLCEKIVEASSARGCVLYLASQYGDSFVVSGGAGELSEAQLTEAFPIRAKQSIALIREQADACSQTLEPAYPSANIILTIENKVIGLLTVLADDRDRLFEAMEALEPTAALVSTMVHEEQRIGSMERRLTETEILYTVVATADGGLTRAEIASRVAREFQAVLQLEHLAIHAIEADDDVVLAQEGRDMLLLDSMKFEHGRGVEGWISSGCGEICLIDARSNDMLPSELIIKERVGSCVILPIGSESNPVGYISAASGRIAGIDMSDVETLRAAAAELSRLLSRRDRPNEESDGILSPKQFIERVARVEGVMITLLPLQIKDLEQKYGKPAMAHAMRTVMLRIRPHVPYGALMCRHPDGMFMVYLPGASREAATEWANEVSSKTPSAGIRTPDGSQKIPLQLRVKVAALDPRTSPQINQLLAAS